MRTRVFHGLTRRDVCAGVKCIKKGASEYKDK